MTAIEQWDVDKTQYFNDRRNAPKQLMIKPPQKVAKAQEALKPQEAPRKREAVAAHWEPVKISPFYILVSCLGIFLFHSVLQAAVVYMFVMGSIDAQGVIVGTMANNMVCGFRLCWKFKQ